MFELDGAVMNLELAKQLIDLLEDGVTLGGRHVLDYHVTTERMRA
jgi:hypothetical protein